MVGWHQRLDGHELEHALGVGDGQGTELNYVRGSRPCETLKWKFVCRKHCRRVGLGGKRA